MGGDLFRAGRGRARHDGAQGLRDRAAAAKAQVGFHEVAAALGLDAAVAAQGVVCNCPACRASGGILITRGDEGGRCGACGAGFDAIGLIQAARDCTFGPALRELEALAEAAARRPAAAGDLFNDGDVE